MPNRLGENLTIDPTTFEVKGATTGKVYGKGTDSASALAIQNQAMTGSASTLSGRPDLLATPQTAGVAVDPITGAGGQPVQPTVATADQLAQAGAGTLPSFNAATSPKPPVPGSDATNPAPPEPTDFATVMHQATAAGAKAGADAILTAPDTYDNQLLLKKSALTNALLGERLTPEDLRFLSPAEQEAVRNGDKANIEAAIGGLNVISQGRKDLQKQQQDAQDKADAKKAAQAATTLEIYTKNNLWEKLPPAERSSLETSLGLPAGTIDALASTQKNDLYDYKYSAGTGNSLIELVTDKKTGRMISTRTIGNPNSGSGTGSDVKTIAAFQKDAADLIQKMDADGGISWATAWDSLHAQYPQASNATIDSVLGGGYNTSTNQWYGRAAVGGGSVNPATGNWVGKPQS